MWLPVGPHPRSRGENAVHATTSSTVSGSSPLTRGKLAVDDDSNVVRGLIPAHAGKTSLTSPTSWPPWVHPHSHRENVMILTTTRPVPFFPAHKGKTSSFSWLLRHSAAHPRSRGENVIACASSVSNSGSSPLTRGKRAWGPRSSRGRRLIPAHAGKTRTRTL